MADTTVIVAIVTGAFAIIGATIPQLSSSQERFATMHNQGHASQMVSTRMFANPVGGEPRRLRRHPARLVTP